MAMRLTHPRKQETAEDIQRSVNVAHHVSEIESLDLAIQDVQVFCHHHPYPSWISKT